MTLYLGVFEGTGYLPWFSAEEQYRAPYDSAIPGCKGVPLTSIAAALPPPVAFEV